MQTRAELGRLSVWSAPGFLLWIPAAVHAFIGWEIVQLAVDRSRGHRDGFDGFDIYWHILVVSAPISVAIAIGWAIIAIARLKVRPDPDTKRDVGCVVLAIVNVIAPVVLLAALMWAL